MNAFDNPARERRTTALKDGIERLKPFPYLFELIEFRCVVYSGYYLSSTFAFEPLSM